MSDRKHSHANGRSDPADLSAGELAAWWDGRTGHRRSGSSDPIPAPDPAVAAVAQLEALARADELGDPRPGFLDELERQIMQTPTAVLPTPIATRRPEPSPTTLVGRPPRRGRGMVDLLTVAAVLALLMGGSWSIWNDRASTPVPDGQNGVAGVSTPDGLATPPTDPDGLAVLDQPWVENQRGLSIGGVLPVNATECVTPSRPAGSVVAALEEREALGDASPTLEPEWETGPRIDPDNYPAASETDVAAANEFFRQVSACRFGTGDRAGTELQPYTGAYWNLFSDDSFELNAALVAAEPIVESVRDQYSRTSSYVVGWSYPAIVADVRDIPPDAEGNARLLVVTEGANPNVDTGASLLVREDGQWRFRVPSLLAIARPVAREVQVADILLGRDAYGPTGAGNFTRQLEADRLIAMTIANVGDTPQQVTVDGQDLGTVSPGGSLIVQPFKVSGQAVVDMGGKLTFTVESVDLAVPIDGPAPRPMTIAVYPAGSLEFNSRGMLQGTPEASAAAAATPGPATSSTPGTPAPTESDAAPIDRALFDQTGG